MNTYLENRIRAIIQADQLLQSQFDLLIKTTQKLGCETHIKGGFCRDIILSILSQDARILANNPIKVFDKEIKDIDVATNASAEEFAKTLYEIAEKSGLNPIEYWNNGDKTEKGKTISVWCVKLFKGVEPLDIVHFRTDSYDPRTGKVEIVDVEDSFSDDFRRDIPWPSIRINSMRLVDYFGVLERLNRGIFIITTPPKLISGELINEFNPMIHHETVERILRLFKFISTPYDRPFAYGFDSKRRFTKVSSTGFILDPDIVRFYTTEYLSNDEITIRADILENLVRWRDNGLLANVFNSISSAVSKRPYHFMKFLIDFKILDVLFDSNHDHDILLKKTRILEDRLMGNSGSHQRMTKPYAIFGFGCKDFDLLQKTLALFSVDKTSIRLARVLRNDTLLNVECNLNQTQIIQVIISNIYDANRSSYESELREFYSIIADHIGLDIDDIPDHEFQEYYDMRRGQGVFRPILIDYLLTRHLVRENMITSDQFNEIEQSLEECLHIRLNGEYYSNYPKIQKIVEYNLPKITKSESKKIKQIISDFKKGIINSVDSRLDTFTLDDTRALRDYTL